MMPKEDGAQKKTAEIPPLGEVIDFMRLIWALDRSLQRTSTKMRTRIGVTGPQRLVLRIIGRFPGILPSQLAAILHVHPSTVTGLLEGLTRRGLITRQRDARDRRRAPLGLTAKGRSLDVASDGTVEAAVMLAFADLPAIKVRTAGEVLLKLTQALERQQAHAQTDGTAS